MILGYAALRLAKREACLRAQRDSEERFRSLAESIPLIVWTAAPGGGIDYCNQRWSDLTGIPREQALGWGWKNALHPDDLPVALENWQKGQQTGKPLDAEYRFRTLSGDYRWHLVRAAPARDSSGTIIEWFGCIIDIDDQMHHQQVLEEQIKEHTAALMDANARLEAEMRERALAQQELDQQNDRMLRELTVRSNRATALAQMAEFLQSCVDLKDILSVISGMAPKIFPELRGAVLLFNSAHDMIEVAASWAECQLPALAFNPQDCWALRSAHLHAVMACDPTAECRHVTPGLYSYFCVPLLSQGEAIGILHFQTVTSHDLPDSIMNVANMLAEQVGLSVANLRLREALRNQSIRDPLTGLFNRRYLEETLEREIRRAVRSEQSLGLMMLDLDHFKKFNDTYGHEAGDTVLREAATFLTKSVRAEDIVCRFGGEEFVVILPMANLQATQTRAERIRSKLSELTVLHQGQSLGMITASLGVAALPQHGTARGPLLEAADAALYRAKREGRDRVIVADLPGAPDAKLGTTQCEVPKA
jgi:diguanylate cyclase (GGDEF)-like protein/PAS domain S-box-containing protein